MRRFFTGVATALVTPFSGGRVDYAALRRLINRQIDMRADALVVLGTTGEISTLTAAEKHSIIKAAVKTVRSRVPLIFGIGGNNPAEIIKLGLFVKKMCDTGGGISARKCLEVFTTAPCSLPPKGRVSGAPCKTSKGSARGTGRHTAGKIGIMVTAPYYNKATQDGIYKFFEKITDAVCLPALVYNIPGRTGVNIEPETLYRISTLPYVAGIKEASGSIPQITEVVRNCPNTAVYSGDDTIALPCYAVGCCGIISVASNLSVAPVKDIYDKYKKGRHASALSLFQTQLPLYRLLFAQVNPIPIKYYLSKRGLVQNELRLPLTPMN
jgi:4-hydroxy-tetrahydrodipicolinate synthase